MICDSVIRGDPDDQSAKATAQAEDIFLEHFLGSFCEMTRDKIVNVRIQLSESLEMLYQKHERM